METFVPILAIVGTFSIPVTAIYMSFRYKMKKLELGYDENGMPAAHLAKGDKQAVQALLQENEELRRRLENVEVIVSDIDTKILGAGTADEKPHTKANV